MTNIPSTKFGHHPWTVRELVDGIGSGQVRLPDIQRPFVWPNAKIRDLSDSMYRGYPVGELMFWANRSGDHTRTIGTGGQDVTMQVVDGQQRLTSLYAVAKGEKVWREDYSRDQIRIAFSPLHERFEVLTPIFERSPEWIRDITTIFSDSITARREFLARLRSDREVDGPAEDSIETAINRVHGLLQGYLFQVVQISADVDRETVADIFVRINSEGISLSSADFILTWMSVFWEEGRQQLDDFARNSRFTATRVSEITGQTIEWTPLNPFLSIDPGQVLRVVVAVGLRRGRLSNAYNALRGRDPRTREINPTLRQQELVRLRAGQERVLNPLHWDEFLKVLERAGFHSKDMITSKNTVLYTYALWLIGRVDFGVAIDSLREVMARWFFMSQITGRYTNSPESAIDDDLGRIDAVESKAPQAFIETLNGLVASATPADWWTISLPEEFVTSSTRAPAYVGYLAALNILDAEVLLSPMKVRDWVNRDRRPIKGIEKHHLFPKDYLESVQGIKSVRRKNQVANYALVEWSKNIAISNEAPSTYWPKQIEQIEGVAQERLASQSEWHALPSGWIEMDYDQFLVARRKLMAKVTEEGFKRLLNPDYSPDLTLPDPEVAHTDVVLPSLQDLVARGILRPGTKLTPVNPDRPTVAEITEDGEVRIGERTFETLNRAAREDGADLDDGWDYWLTHFDGNEEPAPLSQLRARVAVGA